MTLRWSTEDLDIELATGADAPVTLRSLAPAGTPPRTAPAADTPPSTTTSTAPGWP